MGDKKKILAVDDNPANIEILREIFEEEYLLATATNGLEAIQLAERFRPDVILLDVMMPGMDGVETCAKLRVLRKLRNSRIVMVSAKAMPFERTAGMSAGADDYITKPFDENQLRSVIGRLLHLGAATTATT
jgi:two-component system alkaline phosphatase synthesis response regulator PhoP